MLNRFVARGVNLERKLFAVRYDPDDSRNAPGRSEIRLDAKQTVLKQARSTSNATLNEDLSCTNTALIRLGAT